MSDFLLLPFAATFPSRACCSSQYIRVHVGTLPASTHIFVSLLTLRLRVGVTLDWLDGSLGPLIGDLSYHGCCSVSTVLRDILFVVVLCRMLFSLGCMESEQHSREAAPPVTKFRSQFTSWQSTTSLVGRGRLYYGWAPLFLLGRGRQLNWEH